MIISIEKYKESEDVFKKLVENFNKVSESLNLDFRLQKDLYSCSLIKPFNFMLKFGNSLGSNDIMFSEYGNYFYFLGGIDKDLLKEILPILKSHELKQGFKIEERQ